MKSPGDYLQHQCSVLNHLVGLSVFQKSLCELVLLWKVDGIQNSHGGIVPESCCITLIEGL